MSTTKKTTIISNEKYLLVKEVKKFESKPEFRKLIARETTQYIAKNGKPIYEAVLIWESY